MHTRLNVGTFVCVGLSLCACVCVYNNVHIFLLLFAPRIIMGLACEKCRCRKVGLGPKSNLSLFNRVTKRVWDLKRHFRFSPNSKEIQVTFWKQFKP